MKLINTILKEDTSSDITKKLRKLDELLSNCISLSKQFPDYKTFKNDFETYMDAVAVAAASMPLAEKRKVKNDILDSMSAVFKLVETKDKFKAAKESLASAINNYKSK